MSIVSAVAIPFESEGRSVELSRQAEPGALRISALVGVNGTRKSYMLREVVESALQRFMGEEQELRSKSGKMRTLFTRSPDRVLAISAVATDRFPATRGARNLARYAGFGPERYVYFGPRTRTNLVSRRQAAKELAFQLLLAPEQLQSKSKFLLGLLELVGVETKLVMHLSPRFSISDTEDIGPAESLVSSLFDTKTARLGSPSLFAPEHLMQVGERDARRYAIEIDTYLASRALSDSMRVKDRNAVEVHVELRTGVISGSVLAPDVLALGIAAGYFTSAALRFGDRDHDELSTGQWNMLSSLLALAVAARDHTLVLIDEPENGLHPAWQRRYLDLVSEALAGTSGCHVIIATHAPLVMSSLPLANVDLIHLQLKGDRVEGQLLPVPSGWDAATILEDILGLPSARGEDISQLFDSALSQLAEGIATDDAKAAFEQAVARIKPHVDVLPADDPLRGTFLALQSVTA